MQALIANPLRDFGIVAPEMVLVPGAFHALGKTNVRTVWVPITGECDFLVLTSPKK